MSDEWAVVAQLGRLSQGVRPARRREDDRAVSRPTQGRRALGRASDQSERGEECVEGGNCRNYVAPIKNMLNKTVIVIKHNMHLNILNNLNFLNNLIH